MVARLFRPYPYTCECAHHPGRMERRPWQAFPLAKWSRERPLRLGFPTLHEHHAFDSLPHVPLKFGGVGIPPEASSFSPA